MNRSHNFRNIVYLSDTSGTGFWRHIQQILSLNCINTNTNINNTYTQFPILDKNYYTGITSVSIQRWTSKEQSDLVEKFLKPLCDINGAYLLYHIDDDMYAKHIPLFNKGRAGFESEVVQNSIKKMLNLADFVVVTTDKIKQVYHDFYGVPLENIIAVPNFLPRWWIGDRYNPTKKAEQFMKFKGRPRIGIISSLSHYNIDNVRQTEDGIACRLKDKKNNIWFTEEGKQISFEQTHEIKDDLDDIIECIRSTVKDFQWVFCGYCPEKLRDLAEKKLIEIHEGVPIVNYPSLIDNLQLQAIVTPINKIEFNFCKSPIKTMEGSALGIPVFSTNCLPYNRVMKETQLFNDGNELKSMLYKLKMMSKGAYMKMIEDQWKWLNSEHHEGDFDIVNYWLEDNIQIWIDLFRLRNKPLKISYEFFEKQYLENKNNEETKLLFVSENGAKILQ